MNGTGHCCPSGVVNACGVCDGAAAAVLDVHGRCCTGGVLDEMGECCLATEGGDTLAGVGLDSCGVCGGTDTCVVVVSLRVVNATGNVTLDQLGVYGASVSTALEVPAEWVGVALDGGDDGGATPARRRLAPVGGAAAPDDAPVTRRVTLGVAAHEGAVVVATITQPASR